MKNFFKGLSFSQILAGALAAVTSFLLAAKIGIAGSVIGVAIGSIVSAMASQIYQNVIKESSKKIQHVNGLGPANNDNSDLDDSNDEKTQLIATANGSHEHRTEPNHSHSLDNNALEHTSLLPALGESVRNSSETTLQPRSVASGKRQYPRTGSPELQDGSPSVSYGTSVLPHVNADETHRGVESGNGVPGALPSHLDALPRYAPARQSKQSHNTMSEKKKHAIIAICIAVVSALLAVAATAGVISLITKGEGTDHVVRNWVDNSRIKEEPSPTQTQQPEPTTNPSVKPSENPSESVSPTPSASPTNPSASPSPSNSDNPGGSDSPSASPTPGNNGTSAPTDAPTHSDSNAGSNTTGSGTAGASGQ